MANSVEKLKNEYERIEGYLSQQNQISLVSDLNKHFRKVLILSAGSYFEDKITAILFKFAQLKSGDPRIVNFLKKQAIEGKYHTLFDWGEKNNPESPGKNANAFFKLFGDDFKKKAEEDIRTDIKLDESIKAFIEIGHLRNILVHSNFAEYAYEQKTPNDIFDLFQKAEFFLEYLMKELL
jgi:hypothetical protein